MQVDPLWSSTKYLINNGDTKDQSSAATGATVYGGVSYSEAQSRFEGSALLFDGSTGRIELGAAAKFGSGDGSVDGYFFQTSRPALQFLWSQYTNGPGDFSNRTALFIDASGRLGCQKGGAAVVGATVIGLDAWNLFEFTRVGDALYCLLNGDLECTLAISGSLGDVTPCIGHAASGLAASNAYFTGYMSPLRVAIGSGRHTGAYTVPVDAFPVGSLSVSGVIRDDAGQVAARDVRLIRRDSGLVLARTTSSALTGAYGLVTSYAGECQRIVLDDSAGTLHNDLIDRVIPA